MITTAALRSGGQIKAQRELCERFRIETKAKREPKRGVRPAFST